MAFKDFFFLFIVPLAKNRLKTTCYRPFENSTDYLLPKVGGKNTGYRIPAEIFGTWPTSGFRSHLTRSLR